MENETKEKRATFTPGPWTFTLADENSAGGVYGGEKCVCEIIPKELEVTWACEEVSIANANARLIAAAPRMYDMLVKISQGNGYDTLTLAMDAREILAKVDGRVEG